jgi:uncharacterized protein (DUF1800 family)
MPTAAREVAHLLRRAGFGGTASEVSALSRFDRSDIVDRVLDLATAPPDVPPAAFADPATSSWERYVALVQQWIDRMATTPTPVQEKMTLFWHGHFTSSSDKCTIEDLQRQIASYRARSLGNLRALAQDMAIQPAMLDYLDNARSTRWGPNLNFARELLELFLLGVGQYTEDDVVAAARAWTGHTIDWSSRQYRFRSDWHDTGLKTFLGVTRNWDGPQIIDFLLDDARTRTIVARFIAGKLWAFFAGPAVAEAQEAVAQSLLASGWELRPALRTLFLRNEFYAESSRNGLVRTPVEFAVAVCRATGFDAATAHPEWYLANMGQELLNPPDVSGWRPNGYWISTTAAAAKASFASYVGWRQRELGRPFTPGGRAIAPAGVVDGAFAAAGLTEASGASRAAVGRWLERNRAARWDDWAEDQYLAVCVFLTPEFQLA